MYTLRPDIFTPECHLYSFRYVEPGIYTQMEIANGYKCPESEKDYDGFKQYVEDALPTETPVMFRLHPNAEITYLTAAMNDLFQVLIIIL